MTASTASLETLPLLILERICEYLDNDSEKRCSLWAFSLTSRCCCSAAAAQRFCQIKLELIAPEEPDNPLRRWAEVLERNGNHRYVRRLKVTYARRGDKRWEKYLLRQYEETEEEKDEEDWEMRRSFDMNTFCRPSKSRLKENSRGGIIYNLDDIWMPLGRFIGQLPGIQDLVWDYGGYMPPSILSVISAKGCRLHMHRFHLRSLVQHRDSPQPIHPDHYALATSPSLFSIVVDVTSFESGGMLNYTEEGVMRMVAGVAPNLAHVCLVPTRASSELGNFEAWRLGKPAWSGFFPSETIETEANQLAIVGNLRSLVFIGHTRNGIDSWARLTDFSRLRCLIMPWRLKYGVLLAELATRDVLRSLRTLTLSEIEDETDQGQEKMKQLFEGLDRLQFLTLEGYISNETFDIILCCHGGSLRNLSMEPHRDYDSQNPLVVFSEAVVQRMAEKCPNLEQVQLPINRTRGDIQETGIYRALSRLPRLKRAFLELRYSIGPDEEFWNEEKDGEHPFTLYLEAQEIPFVYLREAFSNGAVDASLALSIFNLISSGGSLTYLRLEPSRKITTGNPPGQFLCMFRNMLRWFNRSWVCKRDIRDRLTVRELDEKGTVVAGKEWEYQFSDEEEGREEDEIFGDVFRDIWPQKTSKWWNDWESLPLSEGSV